MDRLEELESAKREIEEISSMLERDRRRSDPDRGVICVLGCEPGCEHVAHLVAALKREEEAEDRW